MKKIRFTKLLSAVILALSFALTVPSQAQIYRGPNSAKQAQKAARRSQKRFAKQQRRAAKSARKAQRRAAKRARRGI
ncbi:MAG TPA: hypothetical protein VJO35_15900 [Terriglobales bacterium]|nr:hypothetical protein [Terriglobales bacterium]